MARCAVRTNENRHEMWTRDVHFGDAVTNGVGEWNFIFKRLRSVQFGCKRNDQRDNIIYAFSVETEIREYLFFGQWYVIRTIHSFGQRRKNHFRTRITATARCVCAEFDWGSNRMLANVTTAPTTTRWNCIRIWVKCVLSDFNLTWKWTFAWVKAAKMWWMPANFVTAANLLTFERYSIRHSAFNTRSQHVEEKIHVFVSMSNRHKNEINF